MLSRRAFILCLALTPLGLASPDTEENDPRIEVQQTIDAIDRYQKFLDRGDYDRTQRCWGEVRRLWQSLSFAEKRTVEKRRPGTHSWMESGEDYDGDLSDPPCD